MNYTDEQLAQYQEYCEAKQEIDEEPLSIEDFLEFNETADY